MSIFTHTDGDGDELEVLANWDRLIFHSVAVNAEDVVPVSLDRGAVRRLVTALIAWETGAAAPEPVYPADSLYGKLIAQAVKAEVARVLPLHLAPVTEPLRCDYDCSHCESDDPEPRDVGHPTYEDAKPEPAVNLTWDDKVWGTHGEAPGGFGYECVCELHNHTTPIRGTSTACTYMGCGCRYRGRR